MFTAWMRLSSSEAKAANPTASSPQRAVESRATRSVCASEASGRRGR